MTSVGIVGGLGPESTVDDYRRIREAWEREDPFTSPSIVIDWTGRANYPAGVRSTERR